MLKGCEVKDGEQFHRYQFPKINHQTTFLVLKQSQRDPWDTLSFPILHLLGALKLDPAHSNFNWTARFNHNHSDPLDAIIHTSMNSWPLISIPCKHQIRIARCRKPSTLPTPFPHCPSSPFHHRAPNQPSPLLSPFPSLLNENRSSISAEKQTKTQFQIVKLTSSINRLTSFKSN